MPVRRRFGAGGRDADAGRPARRDRGQGLVELVLLLPVLLTLTFGILELGTLLEVSHSLGGLSRDGANMAARGAPLDAVLSVTVQNGRTVGLHTDGGVVASRIEVQGGVPVITAQLASPGYAGRSRLGTLGNPATALVDQGLADAKAFHVVEVFAPYQAFTPLEGFVNSIVPDTLYDRSLF